MRCSEDVLLLVLSHNKSNVLDCQPPPDHGKVLARPASDVQERNHHHNNSVEQDRVPAI